MLIEILLTDAFKDRFENLPVRNDIVTGVLDSSLTARVTEQVTTSRDDRSL
jgi:hypothetical protein